MPKPCSLCWWHPQTSRSSERWFSGTGIVRTAISGMLWFRASNFMAQGGLMGIWATLSMLSTKAVAYRRKTEATTKTGREKLDLYLLWINTWWIVLRQDSSPAWWVSAMPLVLPHCLSTDKDSLQTHQQRQADAMLPRINHSHQKFTQANTAAANRRQELMRYQGLCFCSLL